MRTYEPPCEESMTITVSKNRTEEILARIANGQIDGISLREYMEVAFLTLMSNEEQHIEERIVSGGNGYLMHVCLTNLAPNQQVDALRKVV